MITPYENNNNIYYYGGCIDFDKCHRDWEKSRIKCDTYSYYRNLGYSDVEAEIAAHDAAADYCKRVNKKYSDDTPIKSKQVEVKEESKINKVITFIKNLF